MITPHTQNKVINCLIKNSKEFQIFYKENIDVINNMRIHWFENPLLQNGYVTPKDDGTYTITLRKIPPDIENSMIVAHEMGHCILWESKYPKLRSRVGSRDIRCQKAVAPLLSMIYDYHINLKLQNYFSDFCSHVLSLTNHLFIKELKGISEIEKSQRIRVLFVYANMRLWFEFCENKEIQKSNAYFQWFFQNEPSMVSEAASLIESVKAMKFDDPKSVSSLFREIIKKYCPDSIVIIE